MSEVESLRAELAELRAMVTNPAPPTATPTWVTPDPTPWVYVPPPTQQLWEIVAANPEFRGLSAREVRRLAVAVSLCRGNVLHGNDVPREYAGIMRQLAAARGRDLGWRAALAEVNLTPPDDDEIALQARSFAEGLTPLWDSVSSVLATLEVKVSSSVFANMLSKLRPFM